MHWWREAVVYEVYLRSFGDSDGDGIGDLAGLHARLGYLELLGVDALWLAPFQLSPMADHGYDVADPRAVDPVFGDLATFDALVDAVHEHGMRLLVDLVPNHTSVDHEWFRAALTSAPGSPERARYHFRAGRGDRPPNNWKSAFGGNAWTRVPDGEWYLHLFSSHQPDLNWTNPEVWADLEKTLRFWLDRGVDGFRIAAAHTMSKPAGLPDAPVGEDLRVDDDGVHDVHRLIRAVLDHHPDVLLTGDAPIAAGDRFARYLRADELHHALGARLREAPFDAAALREAVEHTLTAVAAADAAPAWTLASHDVARAASRYGGGAVGLARARAMALVLLALPGAAYLYQGEELGLPDAVLPDEVLQDPVRAQSRRTARGRDGHRVPLPWSADGPGYGFTDGRTWLPVPDGWAGLAAERQLEDTGSTLSLYRRAIELRRAYAGQGGDELEWFGAPEGCLAFRRSGSTLVCALNTSGAPVPLPPGDLLLGSGELPDGLLPPGTAAWLV